MQPTPEDSAVTTSVRHFLNQVATDDNTRISEAWEQLSEAERHEAEELAEAEPTMEMQVPVLILDLTF